MPEEQESPHSGLARMRAERVESFDGLSDRELIAGLHVTRADFRSANEFELQRRFVERLTKALDGGTKVAWALVGVTTFLAIATLLLVIAAW